MYEQGLGGPWWYLHMEVAGWEQAVSVQQGAGTRLWSLCGQRGAQSWLSPAGNGSKVLRD